MYMEGIKNNLLSVSKLTNLGNYMAFDPYNVKVYRDVKIIGKLILEGEKHESVYVISVEMAYVENTEKNEIIDL